MNIFTVLKRFSFSLFLLGLPLVSLAQSTGEKLQNPLKFSTVQALVAAVLKIVIQIGTPIAVVMIVWAGFLYVTARGDTGKIETAHKTLLWTVVGTAILLGAALLASVLENTISQVVR